MSPKETQAAIAPPRRRGRSLNNLAVLLSTVGLSFILIALLVVTSSRAAFVAQNDNTANEVSSAAVELTDNDSTAAMFNNVTGLMPGQTEQRCIDVTYTGNVDPLTVRLYSAGTPSGTLPQYLNLTIDYAADTTDGFRDCTNFPVTGVTNVYTGTLQAFAAGHGTYDAGASTWDPAGSPETRTFRFRISVQDVPAAEGLTTTFGFSWETRTS